MLEKLNSRNWGQWLLISVIAMLVLRIAVIPLQIAIAHSQSPQPQAIFVPGSGKHRERGAAQLALAHPELPIWVSSGSDPDWTYHYFREIGISPDRFELDYCAIDTVTNFTCLVDELKKHNIQHVYLATSDFHLPRAHAIGFLVFGSHNIAMTPWSIPTQALPESMTPRIRDSVRSTIWILTGLTFERFHPGFKARSHLLNWEKPDESQKH
jgi:uncharacterized SAM-binding protein YcdF (DUF218 family)